MPERWPTAKASAIAVHIAWPMKLFSSLIVWPAPGPPTWNTFSAKQRSSGSILANTEASAPTITFRRPASASTGVRASGASTKATSLRAQSSRRRAVESGSLVEQSITSLGETNDNYRMSRRSVGESLQDLICEDLSSTPNLEMEIKEGVHGDRATAAMVVNSIPRVISARPGVLTMDDIPISFR